MSNKANQNSSKINIKGRSGQHQLNVRRQPQQVLGKRRRPEVLTQSEARKPVRSKSAKMEMGERPHCRMLGERPQKDKMGERPQEDDLGEARQDSSGDPRPQARRRTLLPKKRKYQALGCIHLRVERKAIQFWHNFYA